MLHRFEISLAHVDRGVYEELDLRVARHPSEDVPYLLTRVLAFGRECKPGLEFTRGLSDGEEPALIVRDPTGRVLEWIEVGQPAPERLHRASKLAPRVVIYAHRRPELLMQRCAKERIHRGDAIEVVKVPAAWLAQVEPTLDRNNRWSLTFHEGTATLVVGQAAFECTLEVAPLIAS